MDRGCGWIVLLLTAILTLAGCNGPTVGEPESSSHSSGLAVSLPQTEQEKTDPIPEQPGLAQTQTDSGYIQQVVMETAARVAKPGMGEYEKAKAAFDYIIETTNIAEPIGLNLWRVRGGGDTPPSFVENRSLSVLLFGIGMCEDYAAALTMLLRSLGLEAEYVPGLTYSAAGTGLVDHAWTVAKIDGVWYHLDPQLEDNISHHNTIQYKYFMRSDATMARSHRWGDNLIAARLLTAEQNEEIAAHFRFASCPRDYPTPQPKRFTPAAPPDVDTLQAAIAAEIRAYEVENGPLEPLELEVIPPVFGLEGYGSPE